MGLLSFTHPKGIKSELSPKILPEGFSTECINCFLDNGSWESWNGLLEVATLGKTGEIKTLHLLGNTVWMHFTEAVSCSLAPIANNDKFYTVMTGFNDGQVRYTDKDLATSGGGTSFPNLTYFLGFPVPSLQLLAAVAQNAPLGIQFQWSIAGTETDVTGNKLTYTYVYTFADAKGREGAPSAPSDLVFASTDDKITLSNFEQLVGTYDPVGTKIRIYRSEQGSPFQFLAEKANDTTDFIDDFSIVPGSAIESTLYSAPPNGLQDVTVMANGMLSGFVGNDIYICEPYQPHAWPEDYIQHIDFPSTGLVSNGNTLIVCAEKYPYTGNITHPTTASLDKLETIPGNISLRSLVEIEGAAIYVSYDGLIMVASGSAKIISEGIISEKTWVEMNPSSMHGYFYRGNYFGFYDAGVGIINTENGETIPAKGSFIFDIKQGYVTYSDIHATAAYSDLGTSSLYLVQDVAGTNKVFKWDGDTATKLNKSWESKPSILKPSTFTAARLEMKTGSLLFELHVDGVQKFTKTVSDSKTFRMPSGYLTKEVAIRLSGTGSCDGAFIAGSPSEII